MNSVRGYDWSKTYYAMIHLWLLVNFINIKVVNRVLFDPRLPISFTTEQEVGIYSNQKQKMGLA